jgi:hypothetical protein
MAFLSGKEAGVPYSLSRWTDLPASQSKWDWFKKCLASNKMVAIDPRSGIPKTWSLYPQDTAGLVFWTKNPTNLLKDRELIRSYKVAVHMTATGWEEVEKGAPTLEESGVLMVKAAKAFKTVYWRFSPIPQLPETELLRRFQRLLAYAHIARVKRVYFSFLQENDEMPETRTVEERFRILNDLAEEARAFGVEPMLCDNDKSFEARQGLFQTGACVPPSDFVSDVHTDNCGCATMVDPFSINESCSYGCRYCYAADKSLSPKKRNTTKSRRLEVVHECP